MIQVAPSQHVKGYPPTGLLLYDDPFFEIPEERLPYPSGRKGRLLRVQAKMKYSLRLNICGREKERLCGGGGMP